MRRFLVATLVFGLNAGLSGQGKEGQAPKRTAEQSGEAAAAGDPSANPQKEKAAATRGAKVSDNPFGDAQPPQRRKKASDDPFSSPEDKRKGRSTDPFGSGSGKQKKKSEASSFANPFGDEKAGGDVPSRTKKSSKSKRPRRTAKRVSPQVALNQPTTLEFIDAPLSECVEFLKNLHGVSIYVDVRALEEYGLGGDSPVNLNVKSIPLRYGLNVLCDSLDLDWMIDEEVIRITSIEYARVNGRTVVYEAKDLAGAKGTVEDLAGLVRAIIDGPNKQDGRRVFAYRSSLVVKATERQHHSIRGLLANLKACTKVSNEFSTDPARFAASLAKLSGDLHPSPRLTAIESALANKTTLEFFDTPLNHVANFLQGLHKVPIQVDLASFEEVGLGGDTPISQNLSDVSLATGLHLMLGELGGVTWSLEDDLLKIVTEEQAHLRPTVKTYPVADLLSENDTMSSLKAILEATLKYPRREAGHGLPGLYPGVAGMAASMDSGSMDSGEGRPRKDRTDNRQILIFDKTLVIAATAYEHDKVLKLLALLRKKQ